MRVCLMIEGQEDVTWEQWVALAEACERSGIEALFRSDHYLSVEGEGGRGWLEAEHRAYGFPFEPVRTRMDVLAEQLEIVHRSWKPGPFCFTGEHYRVEDLDALPKPVQQPHPTLLVGGSGGPRSLKLAAQWADEYNTVFASADRCRELRGLLDEACESAGRERLPLSLMTGVVIGPDVGDLPEPWIAGTVEQAAEQLRELEAAGVERVMLQHRRHEDLETVELIGRELAPAVA